MKRLFNRLRRWVLRRRLRRVCKALDILPYPWQVEFALTDSPSRLPDMGRRTGKTMSVILRALVQPPDGEGALSFIAYDPDADMSLGVQHSIYNDYRRAHAICVKAHAIPNRPPLPLRTIPCRPRGLTASTITMEDMMARYREEIGPIPEDPEDLPAFLKKQFNLPPSATLDAEGYEIFEKNFLRPLGGVDLASHPDMTSGLPLRPVPPKQPARPALPPAGAARSVMIGKAIADGMADGLKAPPAVLYADNKPVVTFRVDSLDALRYALCRVADAATRFAKAMRELVTQAVTDAAIIAQYATPKETHYILHGRKARTRKKYRNRVLRRARRARAKEARP